MTALNTGVTEYILAEPNWDTLGPTFLEAIGDTLWMVAITMVVGGFFGLLLGLFLYTTRPGGILQNKAVYTIINVAVNFFRPIPFIIMIAMLYPLTLQVVGTTIGRAAATFVMCFSATFTVARIVAGYIGGGGVGDFAIVYGYRAFEPQVTWAAVLVIVVIVQLAQFLGNWLSKKVMRR